MCVRVSFMQIDSHMKQSVARVQEQFDRALQKISMDTQTHSSQIKDDILFMVEYSRQEFSKERESLRRELETRIKTLEEVS